MALDTVAARLTSLLGLRRAPVAVAFRPEAPAGIPRVAKAGPAGCSYWTRAADGEAFYTEAADHENCPVGAHTHGVQLSPAKAKELEAVVGTMVGLQYIKMEEVAALPTIRQPFRIAVYAPLGKMPVDPDVVIVRGNARQVMLVAEAARAAGIPDSPAMGRPACAVIPAAMATAQGATSLGCIGNRVYTGLADDELYFAIPGGRVAEVAERLGTIVDANRELEKYHRARLS
jgi:uncharacterized protein (DUF169 family)